MISLADAAVTRVIAIRHGETAWNVDGRIQGQLDIELNAAGQRQADLLAAELAQPGAAGPLAAVYSSDLLRAAATAAPVAAACAVPLALDAGLRERHFGVFQGERAQDIEGRWPEAARRWRAREPDFAPEGAESLRGFSARVVAVVERLARGHGGQTIAVVTHGGVLDCLYRAATRIDLQAARSWRIPNAGVNRLLYTQAGFTLVGWADTQHLDQARDELSESRS